MRFGKLERLAFFQLSRHKSEAEPEAAAKKKKTAKKGEPAEKKKATNVAKTVKKKRQKSAERGKQIR